MESTSEDWGEEDALLGCHHGNGADPVMHRTVANIATQSQETQVILGCIPIGNQRSVSMILRVAIHAVACKRLHPTSFQWMRLLRVSFWKPLRLDSGSAFTSPVSLSTYDAAADILERRGRPALESPRSPPLVHERTNALRQCNAMATE
ncbi:hypothetical protein [Stenotrophomonas sp. Ste71]|uniref:hypothetical protein n=1 Tax=Stenotrophomonas sp. Ste71 TaxID=2926027 RepID=UPI00211841D1|nr:hypothetical protein [Stenotrophomonas sp. Ste71]